MFFISKYATRVFSISALTPGPGAICCPGKGQAILTGPVTSSTLSSRSECWLTSQEGCFHLCSSQGCAGLMRGARDRVVPCAQDHGRCQSGFLVSSGPHDTAHPGSRFLAGGSLLHVPHLGPLGSAQTRPRKVEHSRGRPRAPGTPLPPQRHWQRAPRSQAAAGRPRPHRSAQCAGASPWLRAAGAGGGGGSGFGLGRRLRRRRQRKRWRRRDDGGGQGDGDAGHMRRRPAGRAEARRRRRLRGTPPAGEGRP